MRFVSILCVDLHRSEKLCRSFPENRQSFLYSLTEILAERHFNSSYLLVTCDDFQRELICLHVVVKSEFKTHLS